MRINIGTSKLGIFEVRWTWKWDLYFSRFFYDGPLWALHLGPFYVEGWGWWWGE